MTSVPTRTLLRQLHPGHPLGVSDRVGDSGIIGFVTNAGFLEANTADGLRKCLAEEFSSIYIFHLRGNQRTSGEQSRKEGGKIFGSGSRAPIAITILVKNPQAEGHGRIWLHDIGDYLTQQQKLLILPTRNSRQRRAQLLLTPSSTPTREGSVGVERSKPKWRKAEALLSRRAI
jgi:predicted helicase